MFSADTIERIIDTARRADLDPALLLALVEVETGGRTHAVVNGRREPLIRFEGHYFDRRLSPPDRELARREGLAAPTAGAVHNPPGQAARWRMLERAIEIDRRGAYESTSWGMGQVMGAHWAWLGYKNVDALVDKARSGPEGELDLMLRYIDKAGLMEPLRNRDWAAFARGYNGPAFAGHSYHIKLSLAYRRHARRLAVAPGTPGLLRKGDHGTAVRHLQNLLRALGHPVASDGIFGPRTEAAVALFQRRQGLMADGIAGPATMEAMEKALPLAGMDRTLRDGIAELWRRIVKA
ncbi:N-acetylmuramidase domain-containing protein [Chelativorans salis]|uniref:N-acetylmuramidase domain-containing protein n=1 Tax=Chelativorans salis TaxID=2978478 RepID=A0ABT2LT47_9HYPH|nr:N-acetylmuramidase domain-containing protein [Chelativorans sp. EGI FJ00035]MCT7377521.1 N-acetylmuramidase domain-containing protein [Chelativorans sp. EGI FJ00035]